MSVIVRYFYVHFYVNNIPGLCKFVEAEGPRADAIYNIYIKIYLPILGEENGDFDTN
jgi:hypothetical protein